jgi:hypothetical protein
LGAAKGISLDCSRACQRIGKMSQQLEKAEFEHDSDGKFHRVPTDGNGATKEQQLAAAGISTSTAYRYEQLVGESMEVGS